MASKVISVSLSEAMDWKLDEVHNRTGFPKSMLVSKALLLLFGELESFTFPGGAMGCDFTPDDIEEQYNNRGVEHGKTS